MTLLLGCRIGASVRLATDAVRACGEQPRTQDAASPAPLKPRRRPPDPHPGGAALAARRLPELPRAVRRGADRRGALRLPLRRRGGEPPARGPRRARRALRLLRRGARLRGQELLVLRVDGRAARESRGTRLPRVLR